MFGHPFKDVLLGLLVGFVFVWSVASTSHFATYGAEFQFRGSRSADDHLNTIRKTRDALSISLRTNSVDSRANERSDETRSYLDQQRSSLMAAYNSLGGPSWFNSTGWAQMSANECEWFGISCSQDGIVISISLGSNNLTGVLTEGIFDGLSALRSLDVINNNLYGLLPSSFAAFRSLRTLVLSVNMFEGSYVAFMLSSCYVPIFFLLSFLNLFFVCLFAFYLLDRLPPSWGNLTELQFFAAGVTPISGAIPDTYAGMCPSLRALFLPVCSLSGTIPLWLASCKQLAYLQLSSNIMHGEAPASLGQLLDLSLLDLSANNFTGGIPESLGNLQNVQTLTLQRNALSGPIPASLGNCTQLLSVDLSRNRLTGECLSLLSFVCCCAVVAVCLHRVGFFLLLACLFC